MAEAPRPAAGGWKTALLAGLVGVLIGAVVMAAASGWFVRRALMADPEMIPEAMERLSERRTADAIERHRAALETPFHSAWAGAEDGDVVLVEFFDYACGYCRAANPDVERLLAEDPRLKVVWREYPVLGPDSERAAIASLAAAEAGRFHRFYDRLFATARPTESAVAAASAAAGIGEAELTDAYRAELQSNFELARAIGASGTPTFVVGNEVLHGAVGYEALRDAIAAARSSI